MPLTVIPALHVHDGRAVRLLRGSAGAPIEQSDPTIWASRFAREGASWLQLVDLDAARESGDNSELCREIVTMVTPGTKVMLVADGHTNAELAQWFDAGVSRILVGTRVSDTPRTCEEAIAEFGDRVVVGLDVLDGGVLAPGWAEGLADVPAAVERLNAMGCARVVVRCLASDGMMSGPNYELLGALCARSTGAVVASGGISSIEDLRRLRGLVPIGVEGAVVGTALMQETFTLSEALRVATGKRPVGPEIGA